MRISIFGLGYVGAVCSACWAKEGHEVIGVDVDETKVGLLNSGKSTIVEKDLGGLVEESVLSGSLRATTDARTAVLESDISMVCVGTPSRPNGSLDLQYVATVCQEIGKILSDKTTRHVVVMRSTVLPGTGRGLVIPALESASGKQVGAEIGLASNPEFLRESTAIADFYAPPKTVIGESDETTGDLVASLYGFTDAPLIRTDLPTAEMVKYADNSWHATKITFANEIGNICKEAGIDSHRVMSIFCQDTKLNLSPYYMKPGFAFGGSCLPKDVRALSYQAHRYDLRVPLLESLIPSNEYQIDRAMTLIRETGSRRVGFFGLSFKAGTDDLRESPNVELVERLLGKGYEIQIFDRNVSMARLHGANREYLLERIPHISNLLVDSFQEIVDVSDVLVVGSREREFISLPSELRDDQQLIDLVRIQEDITAADPRYQGICW